MLRVEMIVSRAAKDEIRPMPIFQSKPNGVITGSIIRPALPAKLFWICWLAVSEAFALLLISPRGKATRAQSRIEIERITVPARLRKTVLRESNVARHSQRPADGRAAVPSQMAAVAHSGSCASES